MKKIISLFLLLLFTFTLAGCDLFGEDDIPDEIIDCLTDPDAEGCDIIDPIIDPTDDRSAEEILADAIIENWDGDITHLNVLIDTMDFTDSMELEAEFNFEALDNDGLAVDINVVLVDNYVFLATGDILERFVSLDIDGETLEFTIIYEEVATGVILYLEISDIRDRLAIEEPEVDSVLDVLGVDQDWLKFSFNDSLTNMIEIEVVRELLATIFFSEMGDNFFYELEDEIEIDTGLLFSDYSLDIGLLMETLAGGNYTLFETMVNGIDFDTLLADLDEAAIIPALVSFMEDKQVQLENDGFDVVNSIIYIEANGTEAFLTNLSTEDLEIFIKWLTEDDWRLIDKTAQMLHQEMPWQVISAINLPTEDLETGATITWQSNNPGLITAEGVVTPPVADDWNQWAELIATITVGNESREEWFQVFVPPVNAVDVGDEYHDDWYDDWDDDRNDPIGEYLMDTVEINDIILLIENLKDALLLIDFDALALETVDHVALKDAIYSSQAAFDAFVVTLAATAPESAILLEAFSPVVGYLEEFVFLTDVRYAIDNLDIFDQYLTLDYYLDNDFLDVEIAKTDTFAIETTVTLAPLALGVLFVNVVGDAAEYLSGVDEIEIPYVEHINCPDDLPAGVVCEPLEDYELIIERLNLVSNMEMIAKYDPSNSSEMEFKFDFTEFVDAIINMPLTDDELLDNAVDELYRQMPWQVIAMIDLPTVDSDNEATISWASDRPDLITAAGVVTAPDTDMWDQWVMLTATVTVGNETEEVYFSVTVPPVNAEGYGDEYDNDNNFDGDFGLDISSVSDLSFIVTVSENGAVTLPTDFNDVNAIVEDFARFSLSIMAYDYLENVAWYYVDNPTIFASDFGTTQTLDHYVDDFYVTLAFDDELSEVVIGGTLLSPEFSIDLYWIDGTKVFDTPLTIAELEVVLGEGTGGPATNAIFQYYIDKVNDTNFNMTKLLFVYIFNDTYDDDDEYYDEYDQQQ